MPVSTQASKQNYLLQIYKIHPPLLNTHAFNWARNLVKSAVNLKKIFPNLARLIFRVPPCQKMIKNQLELFITGLDLIQLRSRI